MKRISSIRSLTGKSSLTLGLTLLAMVSVCGCATTSQQQAQKSQAASKSTLVGPDYYQSDDNPFHAD